MWDEVFLKGRVSRQTFNRFLSQRSMVFTDRNGKINREREEIDKNCLDFISNESITCDQLVWPVTLVK